MRLPTGFTDRESGKSEGHNVNAIDGDNKKPVRMGESRYSLFSCLLDYPL